MYCTGVCVCVCARMYHRLINGVGGFIRKNARRQTRDDFRHVELMSRLQHVLVDGQVLLLKRQKQQSIPVC